MEQIGTTTVRELEEHWGHGPEDWGLPPDTDPGNTVYVERNDEGGIRLEVEYAGQQGVPVHDRQTRYIPDSDGGIDGFAWSDLPPSVTGPVADRPDRCPDCGRGSHVLETRVSPRGLRRRRECLAEGCGERWTTYEAEA